MKLRDPWILPWPLALLLLVPACANGDDLCDPNPCTSPPADYCQDGVAFIYPSVGGCRDVAAVAECTYVPAETDCEAANLVCHRGQCIADPCDPNPCTSPPADGCDVNVAVKYATTGTCEATDSDPTCTYPEVARIDCTQNGRTCQLGECVVPADPCAPNPCNDPPADACQDDTAIQYGALGTCTNNGGQADCDYSASSVDCTLDDQVCQLGTCVDPLDPCSPNPCDDPPNDSCQLGNVARQYAALGDCVNNGGNASCDYDYTDIDCDLTGDVCQAGHCVDPCSPNPCTTPPVDDCAAAGEVAQHYPNPGACTVNGTSAVCTYTPTTENCATTNEVCTAGACVAGPCTVNPCTSPPVSTCTVNVAHQYPNPGVCTDNGGSPSCSYPETTVDCAALGGTCSGGACLVLRLFISEYVEGLSNNKYLEIYNPTSATISLDGYKIRLYVNGSATPGSPIALTPTGTIPPGGVWTFGDDDGTLYTPNQVTSTSLWNGNDAVELLDPSNVRLDIVGTIGSSADIIKDMTLVRKPGITSGAQTWNLNDWTQLAVDTHQLGSHTP
jgi:hypothetical protein